MRRVRNRDATYVVRIRFHVKGLVSPQCLHLETNGSPQQGNRCRSGASATTRKSNVAHELAARSRSRGAQDVGVSRFLGFSAGASPSRALHTRRLVAQAVVSTTEACSRSIVIHSGVFSAETGAATALRSHCTATRCCNVHAQVP
jgi:hypothetical protein